MAISKKAGGKKAGAGVAAAKGAPPPKKNGVSKADWREGFKKPQAGVSDMTLLSKVSNEAINDNLKKRFQNGEIYTYIGNVLISVNPFRDLGIYTDETLASYRGKNRLEMTPHVYAIAESSYYQMKAYNENQCVIISGESGAGKTEAAKRIMQYVAAVSGGEGGEIQNIKDMVLATNPLLESFGNAKTLRNNNSSRHGKFLEILFNAQGEPIGANITIYLLEKARVVGQIKDERNFHILYQLTKAATPEQREYFGLQGPEAYSYTANSRCLDVQGIDDVADFRETMNAMNIIGLSGDEQNEILRMLAGVLWIGNVQFAENDQGNAQITDAGVPDFIAYLLEVDSGNVAKALTQRIVETQRGGRRGSVYESPLNCTQASSVRNALAKAIYNNLFDWIVARINTSMAAKASAANMIGILDIFGFEIFDNNSFEQLCINFVNENLQQAFIQLTLAKEQEEYASEGITWTPIKYFDNKIVVDLIQERRPPGVLAALNDACATAHADPTAADNAFSQRLSALSSNPHFDSRGSKFLIRHYAGDVMYNVAGMTEKNKDALLKDILNLVDSSKNGFLHALFPDRPDPDSKKRPPTAGDRIKTSSTALMDTLRKSAPSYIRTIKPNANKSPSEYDDPAVLHQVKYLGLQENVRVRRAGFAYRNTFEKIIERFYLLSPHTSYAAEYTWTGDARSGCERIFTDTGIAAEEWQLGRTKGFIKSPETLFALETMRDRYWHSMAQRIQRAFRNYLRYKDECARRIQRMWLNQKEGLAYLQLRDYGHSVLAGRKERRRFSLLSMRRFMGDYLDVDKAGSAEGALLRQSSGMAPSETVAFSARVTILVSRLGRSSKPSPRFLILTDKAVYFVVTQLVNKVPTTTCERRIALGAISSVGLSALKDDWVLVRTTNAQEPDAFFSCFFKTEFVTHLLQRTNGGISVEVANSLEYNKGKDKKGTYTFKKDENVRRTEGRDDFYKSSTISIPSGEAPSSVSRPPARKKPGVVRPITSGKLLKRGGPSNPKPKPRAVPRPTPKAQPLPSGRASAAAVISPVAAAAAANTTRSTPAAPRRAGGPPPPPPPPPAAAAEPEVPMYKALYAFETSQAGEMALIKDEQVEVTQKEENGWWLVKKNGAEGWAPSNYLELIPPKPKPVVAAAPPPAKRPPPAAPVGAGAAAPAPKPKPAAAAATKTWERPAALAASADAKPIAVMPGIAGEPGGFAAVLARKKAENAAARGEAPPAANGNGAAAAAAAKPAPPVPGPKIGGAPKPPLAPKPGAHGARAMPPPPPRRP